MTDPLGFESASPTDYRWTELASDLLGAERLSVNVEHIDGIEIVFATGPCPRCEHELAFTIERAAPLPGPVGPLGDGTTGQEEPEYLAVDIACQCRAEHPGRLSTAPPYGCGIVFRVEVLRQAGNP